MINLRDRYSAISFRGRLLLLLVAVGVVQAVVAAVTFHSLQSKPVEQRVQSELARGLAGVAPVIDVERERAVQRTRALASNKELVTAIENRDRTSIERLLAASTPSVPPLAHSTGLSAPGAPAAPASGTSAASEPASATVPASDPAAGSVPSPAMASADPAAAGAGTAVSVLTTTGGAYVTGADNEVIAGERPQSVMIEREGEQTATLRRGAELIGKLHVPVVLDQTFLRDRLDAYVPRGVSLLAADENQMVTSKGAVDRPRQVRAGLQELKIAGAHRVVYMQPILDNSTMIGASVSSSKVAADKRESLKSLIGFVFALLVLTTVVAVTVTRSVAGALRKFAGLTEELAAGDLTRRIPVTGSDEVAVLSSSFNEMAENLEQRIENLVEARAKMRRQVDLFGEALANATDISEMLVAVCGLALESTQATHVRFWTIDEDGHYAQSANLGLRPGDKQPCSLERSVAVRGTTVCSQGTPQWMVVPARTGEQIIGLLTLVSANGEFSEDDQRVAERIGLQAAVAIENARLHEMLRLQATRDGLTGLPNHRSLQDALEKMLEVAYTRDQPLGVALLDIDNFKRVNDTFGHKVGDEAIKALARVLDHGIGEMGMAARYGGEEFVVLVPGCDSAATCRIMDRLREDVAAIEVPLEDGGVLTFTASFGVANVEQNPVRADNAEMLRQADVGLYNAKRTGKNRVVLATPTMEVVEMGAAEKAALAARERGEDAPAVAQAA